MGVSGRVVVVTGGSSGIGAATALAVARGHPRAVVFLTRTAAALERVAREVRALGAEALPRFWPGAISSLVVRTGAKRPAHGTRPVKPPERTKP